MHVCQEQIPKRIRVSDTKSNLLRRLEEILSYPPTPISAPPFQLELSDAAAIINYDALQENHFDLQKFLIDNLLETTPIGSEFRPINKLK